MRKKLKHDLAPLIAAGVLRPIKGRPGHYAFHGKVPPMRNTPQPRGPNIRIKKYKAVNDE